MNQDAINKSVLVLMVVAISALFVSMISQFLMAIFLAGLFSALARPMYRRLNVMYKGHKHLASVTTLLLMIFVVLAALSTLGVETASFIAVIGAAGLAVGFALQGSLSNFASGIMLVTFRPIKKGDLAEVALNLE